MYLDDVFVVFESDATGDVEMSGEGETISKSQLKKKLAKRHMSKLKKKGINIKKKKNSFRF